MSELMCRECGKKTAFMEDLCGKCYPTVKAREWPAEQAAKKQREQDWIDLQTRAQSQMTDVEKLIYGQMVIMTDLLQSIKNGVNTTNDIASSPSIGIGFGSIS